MPELSLQSTSSDDTISSPEDPQLSSVVIPLLKGIVYHENNPQLWAQLLKLENKIRDYVSVLQLELILDEAEGYAFLRTPKDEEENQSSTNIPRLFPRRQLSFPISLLLALLRKKLAEFDAVGGDTRLILSRDEIVEMFRLFLPENSNEARLTDQIETHLNKIIKLGFVRKLKPRSTHNKVPSYEVHRILKAFVDADWLGEFNRRLAAYHEYLEDSASSKNIPENND